MPDHSTAAIARTRGAITAHVARHLPGFWVLGGQLGAIIVGYDAHGAVGVVWRPDDPCGITSDDWQRARAEAAMLGYGPGLTLLGMHTLIPPSPDERFVQVALVGNRWEPLLGWAGLRALAEASALHNAEGAER